MEKFNTWDGVFAHPASTLKNGHEQALMSIVPTGQSPKQNIQSKKRVPKKFRHRAGYSPQYLHFMADRAKKTKETTRLQVQQAREHIIDLHQSATSRDGKSSISINDLPSIGINYHHPLPSGFPVPPPEVFGDLNFTIKNMLDVEVKPKRSNIDDLMECFGCTSLVQDPVDTGRPAQPEAPPAPVHPAFEGENELVAYSAYLKASAPSFNHMGGGHILQAKNGEKVESRKVIFGVHNPNPLIYPMTAVEGNLLY